MLSVVILLTKLASLIHAMPMDVCQQEINCFLTNNCFCATLDYPTASPDKIPQMVYFAFDGSFSEDETEFYDHLFSTKQRNPNGCPITMSFYVDNKGTEYHLVTDFFKKGNEIASNSVEQNNVETKRALLYEAETQKKNLVLLGRVPADQVVGWRSPHMRTVADAQPEGLQKFNYTYDTSLIYSPLTPLAKIAWPFTMDFGYPYPCVIPKCPSQKHPGFWEVPVNPMYDREGHSYTYASDYQPSDPLVTFNYLMSNFEKVYKSNRAPFGLNMRSRWLEVVGHLNATQEFMKHLEGLNDVYIVSISRVLEWMKKPVMMSQVSLLPGWGCTNPVNIRAPILTPKKAITTTTTTTTINNKNNVNANTNTNNANTNTNTSITTTNNSSSNNTIVDPASSAINPAPAPPANASSNGPNKSATSTTALKMGPTMASASAVDCVQDANCLLPKCLCESLMPPGGLNVSETPQIIFLTFSKGVNLFSHPIIRDILNQQNPNRCPISATFFVPPSKDSPNLYEEGLRASDNEIAMLGSITNAYGSSVTEQLVPTIKHPDSLQGVSGSINKGFRASRNLLKDDSLYGLLNASDILYDSSLVTSRNMSLQTHLPWPYTLDFGVGDLYDAGTPFPTGSYKGIWEVPLTPLVDFKGTSDPRFQCTYADSCRIVPNTVQDAKSFFQQNLNNVLDTNRAPMGIHLQTDWFAHGLYGPRWVVGLKSFLKEALTRPQRDVYVVTVEKMLDWMKNPIRLADIPSSQAPWGC
ncbi:hypothetical protein ACOMHN_022745 [Nucella lapillus]